MWGFETLRPLASRLAMISFRRSGVVKRTSGSDEFVKPA